MSIQRYDPAITWDMDGTPHPTDEESDKGDFVKYDDHLAAMKELEERMMKWALWWANSVNYSVIPQQAYEYWKDNIDK